MYVAIFLDDAGALGPFAGAGTAENEHDQRLHEAVRAEEKRPAGHQRKTKAQDEKQPAAAAAQHTQCPGRTPRELTAAGRRRRGAGRDGEKGAGRAGARRGPAALAAEASAPRPEGEGLPLLAGWQCGGTSPAGPCPLSSPLLHWFHPSILYAGHPCVGPVLESGATQARAEPIVSVHKEFKFRWRGSRPGIMPSVRSPIQAQRKAPNPPPLAEKEVGHSSAENKNSQSYY